jgi:DNA-binding MarR family transcriptional regulator
MSKQAMHRLLESLEELGYLTRAVAEEDGRARTVRFTERGRAAWHKIYEILIEVEKEWRAALGDEKFEQLKALLYDVWASDLIASTASS